MNRILILILLFVVVMTYSNSFQGVFIYDDYIRIVDNPDIRHPLSAIKNSSRPLTNLTFCFNYALVDEFKAADFHLVNLIIHLIACVSLYYLVLETLKLRQGKDFNVKDSYAAFFISLIWGIHPLNTESVTYIVQRAESLAGMFYILGLLSYVKSTVTNRKIWRIILICTCVCGMLSKPTFVTFPLMVVFYDCFIISGGVRETFKSRLNIFKILFLTWLIPITIGFLPNESATSVGLASEMPSIGEYFLAQQEIMPYYLRLMIYPHPLCIDYGWTYDFNFMRASILFSLYLLLFGLLVIGLMRRSRVAIALTSFFILMLPASSIFPVADLAAEHRLYLPLLPMLILAVTWLLRMDISRRGLSISVIVLAAVSFMFGALTYMRNRDYASEYRMWSSVIKTRPENIRAYLGAGAALLKAGHDDQALILFREVEKRIPDRNVARRKRVITDYAYCMHNLGVLYFKAGNLQEAEKYFKEASRSVKGFKDPEESLKVIDRIRHSTNNH